MAALQASGRATEIYINIQACQASNLRIYYMAALQVSKRATKLYINTPALQACNVRIWYLAALQPSNRATEISNTHDEQQSRSRNVKKTE